MKSYQNHLYQGIVYDYCLLKYSSSSLLLFSFILISHLSKCQAMQIYLIVLRRSSTLNLLHLEQMKSLPLVL